MLTRKYFPAIQKTEIIPKNPVFETRNHTLDWAPVLSGVQQGTVLCFSLFSLYISDTTSDIEPEIRLFADECVCCREIKDREDTLKLQELLTRLTICSFCILTICKMSYFPFWL